MHAPNGSFEFQEFHGVEVVGQVNAPLFLLDRCELE